jgi:rSAM/selenodomain-associated transferase 1
MASMNRTLVIMAKAPRPGSVKTRLAKSLPVQAVTEFYRCLLHDTISMVQTLPHVEVAIMCPASDVEDMTQAVGKTVRVVPQTGSGLAAALDSVFTQFAATGRPGVIALNSDSPHLPASVLQSAFDVLEDCDLVVGPTHDGGYYLVGARATHPGLFAGDRMGTTSAFDALLQRAHALELSVELTEPFYDIDEAADLEQLAAELEQTPGKALRTAEWLRQWKRAAAQTVRNGGVE